jgi:protease-4
VLVLHLEGDVPEKPPVQMPFVSGDGPPVTVTNVWMALRKAAADPHIQAIVLEPEQLAIGWAKIEEIRSGLDRFRAAGKPVYAYLKTPSTREYFLASGADKIYVAPQDILFVKGLRAELTYFKNTLDKVGVQMEVEHAGKYKDYGDMFTRSSMSPETREVMTAMIDDRYASLIDGIARGRKKTPDQVRNAIDDGPFLPHQAKESGLVDELRYEDQMWDDVATRLGGAKPKRVSLSRYLKVPAADVGLDSRKHTIALVTGEGDILQGQENDDGAGDNLTATGFNKLLRRVADDSSIQGVIVRINSPGGESVASDEIWHQMNLLSKKKPVVISMSDAAASGGYMMSMTGDPIVAYPGTLTGSIGVVFVKPNAHGLYDKLGISKDSIDRGRYAGITSEYKSLDDAERAKLREGIDENYRDFVGKVATGRHRKFDDVEPLAQGRVWLGSQAKTRGLVDELGGIDRALELVKAKAKIPAKEQVSIVTYPQRRSLLDYLMRRSQEDPLETRLQTLLKGFPVRSWMNGGYLRLAPYLVEIR